MAHWNIDAVLVGSVESFGPGNRRSAIYKRPVEGPVMITSTGVDGDEHGDRTHHGGRDQAVHHYSFDNYVSWRNEYPQSAERFTSPGFFGENLTSRGFAEPDICVGDLFRIGKALLQVSQARQPCWKLAYRSGIEDFALKVQEAGRTGWFYRVVEPGRIAAGSVMELVERPNPSWTLKRLLAVMYSTPLDRPELEAMSAVPELSAGWRDIARARLQTGTVESWEGRTRIPS